MKIRIVGAGLAGSEAAFQLLKRGYEVDLYEMRPRKMTPAHKSGNFAELVCSNSLKSYLKDTSSGLLKDELKMFNSLIIECAFNNRVPSGSALSVDRNTFSEEIKNKLLSFKNINFINDEYTKIDLDIPTIIATGPLTSDILVEEIKKLTGSENLYFYDAAAPIISADSIDYNQCFFGSRYDKGDKDYLNCPMSKEEYELFYNELINAETVVLREFEKNIFEGCMPIEIMARQGRDTMRFGPLKPVGLSQDGNKRFYAVVQLRKENSSGTMFNIVGFQTNLTFKEQKRVFSLIPALKNAEFLRYGVMHKNIYLNSPLFLEPSFKFINSKYLYFAGQMTGVEGYVESAMSGLLAAINLDRQLKNKDIIIPPDTTICGALSNYIIHSSPDNFQPMNANFGVLRLPENPDRNKEKRKSQYYDRAIDEMKSYIDKLNKD